MKKHVFTKLFLFAGLLFLHIAPLKAQQEGVFETDTIKAKQLSFVTQNGQFDGTEQLCIKVIIPYTNFEMINRRFNKHLKGFTKTKIEAMKGSYRVYPLEWPEICDTSSVYWGHYEDTPYGLVWKSAVQCRGTFVEPHDHKAWQAHEKMMTSFAYEAYLTGFDALVQKQSDIVKEKSKTLAQLDLEKREHAKTIDKNERQISALETDISDYSAEIEALNSNISNERSNRVSLAEKEAIKESKSREKKWSKSRDRARKEQEKKHNQIFNLNEEMSASQQRLLELKSEIPEAEQRVIDAQTELARLKTEYAQVEVWAK